VPLCSKTPAPNRNNSIRCGKPAKLGVESTGIARCGPFYAKQKKIVWRRQTKVMNFYAATLAHQFIIMRNL
tara:strand:+ start:52 stop:264 length:213 start_codon:yes stop_codon:yes gene_type:complete